MNSQDFFYPIDNSFAELEHSLPDSLDTVPETSNEAIGHVPGNIFESASDKVSKFTNKAADGL